MKKSDLHQTAINHTSHSHGFERLYLIFGMVLSFATASPLRRPHFGHVTRRSEHIDHILRPIARFPKSAHMYTHREREREIDNMHVLMCVEALEAFHHAFVFSFQGAPRHVYLEAKN